jgi:ASC-1-like (ASCH) protein
MNIIEKKIRPEYFNLIKSGKKRFELRLADFEINEGDFLLLKEWNPETEKYTGREIKVKSDYILKFKINQFNQEDEVKEKGLYVIQLGKTKKEDNPGALFIPAEEQLEFKEYILRMI